MDKHSLYSPLIESLKDEIEIQGRLLEVLYGESRLLSQNRLPDILDMGIQKGVALRQAEAAAHRRTQVMKQTAVRLGLEAPVSLTRLAACADAHTRQILTDCQEKIAGLIARIADTNEANRRMIALTLAHVNHHIEFLRRISVARPLYDRQGHIPNGDLHGGFISHAG